MLLAMVDCYVGMGGNLEGTLQTMRQIVALLKAKKEIENLQLSRLYRTSAVSPIPQPAYLNAVCRFQTELSVTQLWQILCSLEKNMGKQPKAKEMPRLIDLDLLFYGSLVQQTEEWIIPHPKWHERLFVLAPLADVTEKLPLQDGMGIAEVLKCFSNPHREQVKLLEEKL